MPRGTDRYDEARLQGRLWTPALLRSSGKLWAWYDPHQSAITFATGISQFNDLSGRGNNATQATTTKQPAWSPANKWGRPAVSYDGTSDCFFTPDSGYNGTNGLAAFLAFERSNTAATYRSLIGCNQAAAPAFRIDQTTNRLNLDRLGTTNLATTATACPVGFNVAGFVCSTNLSQIWMNGALTQTATNPSFPSGIQTIGGIDQNPSFPFDALMGEVVVMHFSPTAFERQSLEGYLAWKWGTVGNLVADHRCKNRPPLIGG